MIYDFQAVKNKKHEVFDAKFGSLNQIFGNCSCLKGFRYVWIFFKIRIFFWQSEGHRGQKLGKKLTKFGFFDLKLNFILLI